jgi:hypothetical protein
MANGAVNNCYYRFVQIEGDRLHQLYPTNGEIALLVGLQAVLLIKMAAHIYASRYESRFKNKLKVCVSGSMTFLFYRSFKSVDIRRVSVDLFNRLASETSKKNLDITFDIHKVFYQMEREFKSAFEPRIYILAMSIFMFCVVIQSHTVKNFKITNAVLIGSFLSALVSAYLVYKIPVAGTLYELSKTIPTCKAVK